MIAENVPPLSQPSPRGKLRSSRLWLKLEEWGAKSLRVLRAMGRPAVYVLTFMVPVLTIGLLAVGLDIFKVDEKDLWIRRCIFFLVTAVALVPVIVLLSEIFSRRRASRYNGAGPIDLTDVAVHVVPFGILSVSMLLEYEKVKAGEAEGIAAISAIMILFTLSELGLFLFQRVKRAEDISSKLNDQLAAVDNRFQAFDSQLKKVDSTLEAIPFVNEFLALSAVSAEDNKVVAATRGLLRQYQLFLGQGPESTKSLKRLFLSEYLYEELSDLTADLPREEIPKEIWQPEGTSYLATNVGFYARFLENAVGRIAKEATGGHVEPDRSPCIAVITNALPSQFWNWPYEDRDCWEFYPVARYRDAQFEGVSKFGLKLFRIMLVANDEVEAGPEAFSYKRSIEVPHLWSKGEWMRQKEWAFAFANNNPSSDKMPLHSHSVRCPENDYIQGLSWTGGNKFSRDRELRRGYWIFNHLPPEGADVYTYQSVWDHYCNLMHGDSPANGGFSAVYSVSRDEYLGQFEGCPDIMFIGSCGKEDQDAWRGQSVQWSLALLSTMSTQTQTMFLAVVSDPVRINALWKSRCDALRGLSSESRLVRGPG